jgi:hypothetical protein
MVERDQGPLERLLGPFASVRILDFFSTFREFDYSMADIARNTELSGKTVQMEIPKLISYGVVSLNRTVGRAQMYMLNAKSPIANRLNSLVAEIARFDSEKLIVKEPSASTQTEIGKEEIVAKP